MNDDSHREKWGKMSYIWGLVLRPGRPSVGDVQNYRDLVLRSEGHKKVLILGSTPEIRDMFAIMNKDGEDNNVTCVDMVRDMYQSMKLLMRESPETERFVEGNWLELPKLFSKGEFDIVIGDWVSVNVGNERDKFYSGIRDILRPGGYFIERCGIIPPETPKIEKTVEAVRFVFKEQIERARSGEISKDQAWNYFASKLMMSAYFLNDQHRIDWGDTYISEIKELEKEIMRDGDETEKYVLEKFYEVYGPTSGKYWTILSKDEQEKVFKEFFELIEIRVTNDYDELKAKESPIYLLQNRQ